VAFVLTGDPVQIVIREGPYTGVEVEVLTDLPLGVTVGIGRAMTVFGQAEAGSAEETVALQTAWTIFASDVLVGWNLYDRQGVVPPDASAFGRVSPRFITQLLTLWADLMTPEGA
jgi:hypothetical protein